jgi:hypothetical protein
MTLLIPNRPRPHPAHSHMYTVYNPTLPTPTLFTFYTRNTVYVRRLDPSVLEFSLSLHRHPFICILFNFRFTSYNKFNNPDSGSPYLPGCPDDTFSHLHSGYTTPLPPRPPSSPSRTIRSFCFLLVWPDLVYLRYQVWLRTWSLDPARLSIISTRSPSVSEVFISLRFSVQSLIIPTPIYMYSLYLSFYLWW